MSLSLVNSSLKMQLYLQKWKTPPAAEQMEHFPTLVLLRTYLGRNSLWISLLNFLKDFFKKKYLFFVPYPTDGLPFGCC